MGKSKVVFIRFSFNIQYVVEEGFSEVFYMRNKCRDQLDMDKTGEHAIRLKLTTLHFSFASLAEKHQAQGSH